MSQNETAVSSSPEQSELDYQALLNAIRSESRKKHRAATREELRSELENAGRLAEALALHMAKSAQAAKETAENYERTLKAMNATLAPLKQALEQATAEQKKSRRRLWLQLSGHWTVLLATVLMAGALTSLIIARRIGALENQIEALRQSASAKTASVKSAPRKASPARHLPALAQEPEAEQEQVPSTQ